LINLGTKYHTQVRNRSQRNKIKKENNPTLERANSVPLGYISVSEDHVETPVEKRWSRYWQVHHL